MEGMATGPEERPADLPDDALLVRGGIMESASTLDKQAEANLREHGERSLSVFASADLDLEGIVREARSYGRYLPHGHMATTTAGKLRGLGLELRSSPPPPGHYSLMIPHDATDDLFERLMMVFDNQKTPQGRMRDAPPTD